MCTSEASDRKMKSHGPDFRHMSDQHRTKVGHMGCATHILIARPQQFLLHVKSYRTDRRGHRMDARWGQANASDLQDTARQHAFRKTRRAIEHRPRDPKPGILRAPGSMPLSSRASGRKQSSWETQRWSVLLGCRMGRRPARRWHPGSSRRAAAGAFCGRVKSCSPLSFTGRLSSRRSVDFR